MGEEDVVAVKYRALEKGLNESMRRRWAATEAKALGRGGATRVSRATGISLPTIRKGLRELEKVLNSHLSMYVVEVQEGNRFLRGMPV